MCSHFLVILRFFTIKKKLCGKYDTNPFFLLFCLVQDHTWQCSASDYSQLSVPRSLLVMLREPCETRDLTRLHMLCMCSVFELFPAHITFFFQFLRLTIQTGETGSQRPTWNIYYYFKDNFQYLGTWGHFQYLLVHKT